MRGSSLTLGSDRVYSPCNEFSNCTNFTPRPSFSASEGLKESFANSFRVSSAGNRSYQSLSLKLLLARSLSYIPGYRSLWNRVKTPPGNSTSAKRWGAHACFSTFSTKSTKNDFSSELACGSRARPNTRSRVEKSETSLVSLARVSGQLSKSQRAWLKTSKQVGFRKSVRNWGHEKASKMRFWGGI